LQEVLHHRITHIEPDNQYRTSGAGHSIVDQGFLGKHVVRFWRSDLTVTTGVGGTGDCPRLTAFPSLRYNTPTKDGDIQGMEMDLSGSPPRKRRRFQYSLRAMLLLFPVVAVRGSEGSGGTGKWHVVPDL
jgi:hypothetical protein